MKNNRNLNELVQLAKFLSGGEALDVFTGGTGAATIKILKPNNSLSVIKLATTDGAGLNNGRRKLIREARQINYLRKIYNHHIEDYIPEVFQTWETKSYGAVEYPFYEGQTFANLLRTENDTVAILHLTRNIIQKTLYLYLLDYKKSGRNSFFEKKYIARSKFRLTYTMRGDNILNNIFTKKAITINNERFRSPRLIIQKIEKDVPLRKKLSVNYLSECIHGDLNFRNIIVSDNEFRFLDLRGARTKWDVFYDLGKMLFTSGFDRICHFEFDPKYISDYEYKLAYKEPSAPIHNKWEFVQTNFENILDKSLGFEKIKTNEIFWRSKLRFAHAIHYLADCACRVESGSPLNQALASFLIGTIYLNRFYDDINATSSPNEHYSLKKFI